jgi:hypothetical protein
VNVDYEVESIYYHYMDWFDGAKMKIDLKSKFGKKLTEFLYDRDLSESVDMAING